MEQYGLKFHHLGLATATFKAAIHLLEGLGYKIGEPVLDRLQNVELIMCCHATMPNIELITPGRGESPVDAIIAKHNGAIYHLCFTTENVENSISAMENDGQKVLCLSESKEAILFDNKKVSFYHVAGFGVIEFIEWIE